MGEAKRRKDLVETATTKLWEYLEPSEAIQPLAYYLDTDGKGINFFIADGKSTPGSLKYHLLSRREMQWQLDELEQAWLFMRNLEQQVIEISEAYTCLWITTGNTEAYLDEIKDELCKYIECINNFTILAQPEVAGDGILIAESLPDDNLASGAVKSFYLFTKDNNSGDFDEMVDDGYYPFIYKQRPEWYLEEIDREKAIYWIQENSDELDVYSDYFYSLFSELDLSAIASKYEEEE